MWLLTGASDLRRKRRHASLLLLYSYHSSSLTPGFPLAQRVRSHLEEITIFVDPQLLFLDSRQRECRNYSPLYPSSEGSLRHMAKATTTIRQMVTRIGIASRYILVAHIHVIRPCYRYPALPGSRPNDGAFTPGIPVYWSVLVRLDVSIFIFCPFCSS